MAYDPQQIDARQIAMQIICRLIGAKWVTLNQALTALQEGTAYRFWIKVNEHTGKRRNLSEPCEPLKEIQTLIKVWLGRFSVDRHLFAFVPGRSILDNVEYHLTYERIPKWMVALDLKDAFPSVKSPLLSEMFRKMVGFWPAKQTISFSDLGKVVIAEEFYALLVRLVTFNDCLPQGSPCSPPLFNLALMHTGLIAKLAGKIERKSFERRVSVYCDDITITSLRKIIHWRTIEEIIRLIEMDDIFTVNPDKTKRNKKNRGCHHITGISLRTGKRPVFTLSRKKQKRFRGQIHRATMILRQGRLPTKEQDGFTVHKIFGIINWIWTVYQRQRVCSALRSTIGEFQHAYHKIAGK